MRMLFSFLVLFLITACYPCEFLDWNCSRGVSNTSWGKTVNKCEKEQLNIALKKERYTRELHIKIINQCTLSDGNYKYSAK